MIFMNAKWAGIFAALWTPTGGESGVLRAELAAKLRFLQQHRIDGVLALASTGEFLLLTPDQRNALLQAAMESAGNLAVIANVSDMRPGVWADLERLVGSVG